MNVGSAFTEAQPGSTLTALCFEIVYSLLRKIMERGFQILTLMNFHEPLEIKCNFQQPSSSESPLLKIFAILPKFPTFEKVFFSYFHRQNRHKISFFTL